MSKLEYLQQKKLNPADELRETLSSLEERLVKVRAMTPEQALHLLHDLDQVEALFQQLEPSGLNLLPEQGRFTSVQARLRQQAGPLLKALGGAAALEKHRPAPPPAQNRWWWYLDQLVAGQRRRLVRGVMLSLLVILAFAGGVMLLFRTILAPSPEAVARLEAQDQADAAMAQGNYAGALTSIEAGLAKVPHDPDLLIYRGIVQELLGDEAAARQSFEQAQAALNAPSHFYLARSQLQLRLGRFAEAEHDARAAVELDPNLASAWLILGQVLEAQQKIVEAVPAYQKASDLANANNEAQIYVTARLALARLGAIQ